MNEARYTQFVPQVDDLGNPLKNLADAARTQIENTTGGQAWEEAPKNKGAESFGVVSVVATETPETDSQIKQIAHQIAEVANKGLVVVIKEGKQGIKTWQITNTAYVPGGPAESVALLPSSVPVSDQLIPQQPSQP